MRVSLSWLQQLVDLPASVDELVQRLIAAGTEIEAVERIGEGLENVVVGYVVSCEDHPDSDHLHVCQVDVSAAEPLQIVCGAPNVAAGQKVPVACVGAVLPGDFKIKTSKLRGVSSHGMICSAKELGLSADHAGIMVLEEDARVGQAISEYLDNSDTVLVADITPNRPDCLSMRGFAREVSAVCETPEHIEFAGVASADGEPGVRVEVEDGDDCPRYVARIISGIEVGDSPEWLQRRLEAAGIRAINNVVDISNYVMLLTGQPLHMFDADTFSTQEPHVVVRRAKPGERIETLDGQVRELTPDMLVITDAGGTPQALAGVMGGLHSEISEQTTRVLLESAMFNAGRISRTSRDLQLVSEASLRYERGVDRTFCATAADIACALLQELAGGTLVPGEVDVYQKPYVAPHITLRFDRVREICGADIEDAFMVDALTRLGCEVTPAKSTAEVVPPALRPDLQRECDLTEEILRLYGMDRVSATLPHSAQVHGGRTLAQQQARKIKQALLAFGASEAETYCFAENDDAVKLGAPQLPSAVELLNPLTHDMRYMRQLFLPGLLRSVQRNLARSIFDVALFEQGRVFAVKDEDRSVQPEEIRHVGCVLTGNCSPKNWAEPSRALDFYDSVAAIESIAHALRIPKMRLQTADPHVYTWLQPGRAACVYSGKTLLGWVGNVHPKTLKAFDIDVDVCAFELDQEALIAAATPLVRTRELADYPAINIDLALALDEDVPYETVAQRLRSAGGKWLESAELFDVYRDEERLGKNKKSLAFALTFRAQDRSLTSEEVAACVEKISAKLECGLGAEIRS